MGERDLVIVGAGEFGDIAYEYFTVDSPRRVAGFAVERAFLKETEKFGLPVVAMEDMATRFPPATFDAHVALGTTPLDPNRRRVMEAVRAQGFTLASYVSSRAFVWRTAEIGENVFIFEDNTIQHGVRLHDGVVLWSGNHIGHQSRIGAYSFVSSHVVVSGFCTIGRHCYLGVNACLADNLTLPDHTFVAMAAVVNKAPSETGRVLSGNPAEVSRASAYRLFRVKPDALA